MIFFVKTQMDRLFNLFQIKSVCVLSGSVPHLCKELWLFLLKKSVFLQLLKSPFLGA